MFGQLTSKRVLGAETVCPECGDMFMMDINLGDDFLFDVCLGCGYKRKKRKDGKPVELVLQEHEDVK